MGKWGDGEMGKWGDGEMAKKLTTDDRRLKIRYPR
jgi:hypothetical protein